MKILQSKIECYFTGMMIFVDCIKREKKEEQELKNQTAYQLDQQKLARIEYKLRLELLSNERSGRDDLLSSFYNDRPIFQHIEKEESTARQSIKQKEYVKFLYLKLSREEETFEIKK